MKKKNEDEVVYEVVQENDESNIPLSKKLGDFANALNYFEKLEKHKENIALKWTKTILKWIKKLLPRIIAVYLMYLLLFQIVPKIDISISSNIRIGIFIFTAFFLMMATVVQEDESDDQIDKKRYKEEFMQSMSMDDSEDVEPQKDILGLMIDNLAEIREYFQISKSHARKAFVFAVAAFIVGLCLLSGSIIIAFQTKQATSAIIAAIGGAIVELVSAFALHIYKNSQEQLNHYYKALHDNEQYLSTVHLVSKLSKEKQDDTYISIIESNLNK